jgi:hypothetical protein
MKTSFNINDDEPSQIPLNRLSKRSNNSVLSSRGSLKKSLVHDEEKLENDLILENKKLSESLRTNNKLLKNLQKDETSRLRLNRMRSNERQLVRDLEEDYLVNDMRLNERPLRSNQIQRSERQLVRDLEEDQLENEILRSKPTQRSERQLLRNLEEDQLTNDMLRSKKIQRSERQLLRDLEEDQLENDIRRNERQLIRDVEEDQLENDILRSNRNLIRRSERQLVDNQLPKSFKRNTQFNCMDNADMWTIKFRLPGQIMISHEFNKNEPLTTVIKQLQSDLKYQGGIVLILPTLMVVNSELSTPISQTGIQNYNTIVVTKA